MRNNNPLNIEFNKWNAWAGARRPRVDRRFEEFDTIEYGFRAAVIVIHNYIKAHHCETIEDVIRRWAPAHENNTEAYIKTVEEVSGLSRRTVLFISDKAVMTALVHAMAYVECGCSFPMAQVERGYDMAYARF